MAVPITVQVVLMVLFLQTTLVKSRPNKSRTITRLKPELLDFQTKMMNEKTQPLAKILEEMTLENQAQYDNYGEEDYFQNLLNNDFARYPDYGQANFVDVLNPTSNLFRKNIRHVNKLPIQKRAFSFDMDRESLLNGDLSRRPGYGMTGKQALGWGFIRFCGSSKINTTGSNFSIIISL